jgi:hypothetical protein
MADHSCAWREYRRLRRQGVVVLLGGFVLEIVLLVGMTLLLGPAGFHRVVPITLGSVAIVWFVASIIVGDRYQRWPCPRCGRPFGKTFWWHNPFARKCVHCGLPKWTAS